MEWLEARYKMAMATNNLDEMNQVLEALVRLLIRHSGGQDETFEDVRRELRRRAPNAGSEVMHLTKEELRELRYSPTPNLGRLRVRPRSPARRAQRRRGR